MSELASNHASDAPRAADRLTRLEREVARLRWAALALGLLLVLALIDRGTRGQEIVGRELILRDKDGRKRATIDATDGSPALRLFDQAERLRLQAGVEAGLPTLRLLDQRRTRLLVALSGEGTPTLQMTGSASGGGGTIGLTLIPGEGGLLFSSKGWRQPLTGVLIGHDGSISAVVHDEGAPVNRKIELAGTGQLPGAAILPAQAPERLDPASLETGPIGADIPNPGSPLPDPGP